MGALVSGFFSALFSSAASLLSAWFAKKEYQQQGRTEQNNADLQSTVKADQDARVIEANNAVLDRDALLAKLHEQSAGRR